MFDKSFYPLGRGNYYDPMLSPEELSDDENKEAAAKMLRPGLVSPAAFQDSNIVFIAAGELSSIAVTDDGVLYSWGGAETDFESLRCLPSVDALHVRHGYLGLGNTESRNTPQRVGGSECFDGAGVRQAACGQSHMLVLTDDERIWSVGLDTSAQLGQDEKKFTPTPINMDDEIIWSVEYGDNSCLVFSPLNMCHFQADPIVLVAAGDTHSAAVTEGGRVYAWGDTDMCICAFAKMMQPDTTMPLRVPSELFAGARVGLWNGSARGHILALAMAMAERLGVHSSAALNDDVLYKIAHVYTKRFAHLGQGQRTLMGLW